MLSRFYFPLSLSIVHTHIYSVYLHPAAENSLGESESAVGDSPVDWDWRRSDFGWQRWSEMPTLVFQFLDPTFPWWIGPLLALWKIESWLTGPSSSISSNSVAAASSSSFTRLCGIDFFPFLCLLLALLLPTDFLHPYSIHCIVRAKVRDKPNTNTNLALHCNPRPFWRLTACFNIFFSLSFSFRDPLVLRCQCTADPRRHGARVLAGERQASCHRAHTYQQTTLAKQVGQLSTTQRYACSTGFWVCTSSSAYVSSTLYSYLFFSILGFNNPHLYASTYFRLYTFIYHEYVWMSVCAYVTPHTTGREGGDRQQISCYISLSLLALQLGFVLLHESIWLASYLSKAKARWWPQEVSHQNITWELACS